MNLRINPEVKMRLMRAAALRHTDLTDFVTQTALREANAVITEAEEVKLSARDSRSCSRSSREPAHAERQASCRHGSVCRRQELLTPLRWHEELDLRGIMIA